MSSRPPTPSSLEQSPCASAGGLDIVGCRNVEPGIDKTCGLHNRMLQTHYFAVEGLGGCSGGRAHLFGFRAVGPQAKPGLLQLLELSVVK